MKKYLYLSLLLMINICNAIEHDNDTTNSRIQYKIYYPNVRYIKSVILDQNDKLLQYIYDENKKYTDMIIMLEKEADEIIELTQAKE